MTIQFAVILWPLTVKQNQSFNYEHYLKKVYKHMQSSYHQFSFTFNIAYESLFDYISIVIGWNIHRNSATLIMGTC